VKKIRQEKIGICKKRKANSLISMVITIIVSETKEKPKEIEIERKKIYEAIRIQRFFRLIQLLDYVKKV